MSKLSGRVLALIAGGIVLLAAIAFVVWRGSADASETTADVQSSVVTTSSPALDSTASAESTVAIDTPASATTEEEGSTSAQGEGSKTAAAASSTEPADEDMELAEIATPPKDTLAAISPDASIGVTSLNIVFEPYGTTSIGSDDAVVVLVTSVDSPEVKDNSSLDLEGRNLLLRLQGASVDVGGVYEGVVRLRETDDKMVFVLEFARRISPR